MKSTGELPAGNHPGRRDIEVQRIPLLENISSAIVLSTSQARNAYFKYRQSSRGRKTLEKDE